MQFGSTVALARILSPEDFGLIAMVTAVSGFLMVLKDIGLGAATIQSRTIDHEQANTSFWINVLFGIALTALFAASAPLLAWFYHEPALAVVTPVVAASFFIHGFCVQHSALLNRALRFGTLMVLDLSSGIVGVGAGLTLAALGARYWALAVMPLASQAVYGIGVWIAMRWRPTRPRFGGSSKRLLSFGGYLTGVNVLGYASRSIDNILIGWYWGAHLLGVYTRAYQLLLLPIQQINGPIGRVALPALSRLQDRHEEYRKAYLVTQDKLNLVVMPLVAFMVMTADWLIAVLLGPQWSDSARIFIWLGVAGLLFPAENTTGWLFLTQGRTKEMFQIETVAAGIAIASIVVGVFLGPVYVAAFFALTFVTCRVPLVFWYVGRKGPVHTADLYRAMQFPAGVAIVLGGLLAVVRWGPMHLAPLPGLGVSVLVAIVVMALALLLLPQGRRRLTETKRVIASAGAHK